jgi:MFS family permease
MNRSNEAQAHIGDAASRRTLPLSLLVIATAQLMLVLDDTIANIALPSIQRDLGVSQGTLPWIVNAYVLASGSLLLFGGRLGDLCGRRLVLRIGWACLPSRRCSVDSAGLSHNSSRHAGSKGSGRHWWLRAHWR